MAMVLSYCTVSALEVVQPVKGALSVCTYTDTAASAIEVLCRLQPSARIRSLRFGRL